jgi:site-specific recombinase XerD
MKKPTKELLELRKIIDTDKAVSEWFKSIGNKRTISNYRNDFPKFLKFVREHSSFKTPSEIIEQRRKDLQSKDPKTQRRFEALGKEFMHQLESQHLRYNSIKTYLRTMESLFSRHYLNLKYARGELDPEVSEKDKIIREWAPSNEDCRLLYRLCKTARDRALLLTLYQSGFSEIDALSLKIQDLGLYGTSGNWRLNLNEDLYVCKLREKTNIPQKTMISREALEEIRIMLQQRGFPKEGFLFETQKNEPMTVRALADMFKALVESGFKGRSSEWQTRKLRDSFGNALLKAQITAEVKDTMFGHKRQGARENYEITEDTIRESYETAFKYLTINGFGSTQRTVEELKREFQVTREEDKKKIDTLIGIMTNLQAENTNLKQKLATVESNTNSMSKEISSLTTDIDVIQKKLKIKPKPIKEFT